jgi:magnesium protoporphyrin O-methyltransferase
MFVCLFEVRATLFSKRSFFDTKSSFSSGHFSNDTTALLLMMLLCAAASAVSAYSTKNKLDNNVKHTGAKVSASDISNAMATEAASRAKSMGVTNADFYTSDLESVTGKYNTVTCVDVAIHYPTEKMAEMVGHLCSLAEDRVLISFAPKTWYYELLKKIGELFPGPSKTTRAYLHEERVVRDALEKAGFKVAREEMTGTNFYFSRLLEAKRA